MDRFAGFRKTRRFAGMTTTFDDQIIRDMQCADQLKAKAPNSAVTADAIFLALRGLPAGRRAKRANRTPSYGLPPQKFHDALAYLKGRSLTIGEFTTLSGMGPAGKQQRNAIGAWLRTTGRMPRKSGARQVFDI